MLRRSSLDVLASQGAAVRHHRASLLRCFGSSNSSSRSSSSSTSCSIFGPYHCPLRTFSTLPSAFTTSSRKSTRSLAATGRRLASCSLSSQSDGASTSDFLSQSPKSFPSLASSPSGHHHHAFASAMIGSTTSSPGSRCSRSNTNTTTRASSAVITPHRCHGMGRSPAATDLSEEEQKARASVTLSRVLLEVAHYLWPKGRWDLRALVVVSVGCVLASKVLKLVVPFWFKTVIDTLSPGGATAAEAAATVGPFTLGVFSLVTAYGVTRAVSIIADEAKTALFAPVGGEAATSISMRLFHQLHNLDLSFHLNRQTGVLAKDLERGSRAFWSLSYIIAFMVFPILFEMILVGAVLQMSAGPVMATTGIFAVVAYVAWTYFVTNWRAKFRDRYNVVDSRVGGMVMDTLFNYETVKYFSNEEHEAERVFAMTKEANQYLVQLDQTMAVLNLGQQGIFATAAVGALYFSVSGVLGGAMTVGDLVLVDSLLLQLYTPLSFLGMLYRELQSSTQNMQAMIALLEQRWQITDAASAKPFEYRGGALELRDVSFRYNNTREVLKKVSLTIPAGKTVAFVGPSGSGKSTLFRLLFRFYDPSSGEILVDGQSLKDVQLSSYRQHVGVVPQDPVLFNETVTYNIGYGRAGAHATHAEVEAAARSAQVHDTISHLREGYDTVVGERGVKLSGGEKQRVAIARVVLKGARILLADEATSALDTLTERSVMNTLKDAAAHQSGDGTPATLIIIAHRLTTVKDADIIFVLNNQGQLIEQGRHEALLQQNGTYGKLWYEQLKDPTADD